MTALQSLGMSFAQEIDLFVLLTLVNTTVYERNLTEFIPTEPIQ